MPQCPLAQLPFGCRNACAMIWEREREREIERERLWEVVWSLRLAWPANPNKTLLLFHRMISHWPACRCWATRSWHPQRQTVSTKTMSSNSSSKTMSTSSAQRVNTHSRGEPCSCVYQWSSLNPLWRWWCFNALWCNVGMMHQHQQVHSCTQWERCIEGRVSPNRYKLQVCDRVQSMTGMKGNGLSRADVHRLILYYFYSKLAVIGCTQS